MTVGVNGCLSPYVVLYWSGELSSVYLPYLMQQKMNEYFQF